MLPWAGLPNRSRLAKAGVKLYLTGATGRMTSFDEMGTASLIGYVRISLIARWQASLATHGRAAAVAFVLKQIRAITPPSKRLAGGVGPYVILRRILTAPIESHHAHITQLLLRPSAVAWSVFGGYEQSL